MQQSDTRRGIALMVATTFVFAAQDGISAHLASTYNVIMVVTIRYWFFALFVVAYAASHSGLRASARSARPWLQIFRGVLLVAEICVMVLAFAVLGLVESHAVFACYPLLVAALSVPVLGERVGPRRWIAIGIGFAGVLVILSPGSGVFSPWAVVPLISALMFALYGLLTRLAAREDEAITSFFWTGVAGVAAITPVGLFFLEPMTGPDYAWMAVLCVTGALGHFLLIKAYEAAEASAIQPLAYLQLVFASLIGVTLLSEDITPRVLLGAAIVVCAGLFTLLRARRRTVDLARPGAHTKG